MQPVSLPLQGPHRNALRALLRHSDQAVHEIRYTLAEDQRIHRMQRAICIPQRESAVVVGPLWKGMYLAVHAAILPIYIVEQCGGYHHVVQAGVEDFQIFLVVRAHLNASQLSSPGGMGRNSCSIEVPSRGLGDYVGGRALNIHARDTGLHLDDFIRLRLELQNAA